MQLYLEGLSAAVLGRRVTVTAEKPYVIRANTTHRSGDVTIAYVAGQFCLTNSSPLRCLINGKELQQSRLNHADNIEIGKDRFCVTIEPKVPDKKVPDKSETDYVVADHDKKKNTPDDALRTNNKDMHQDLIVDTPSQMTESRKTSSSDARYDNMIDEDAETAEHPRAGASGHTKSPSESGRINPESDHYRQSRRISASRLAAIDPAPKAGLLSKVTKVFQRKDEREQRLVQLEAQRKALLVEAGRHALGPGGSLGLPDAMVKTILMGGSVTINPSDVLQADVDRWRTQRQQMVLFDAEIAALRRALGLGQDPRQHNEQAPTLRADQRALQERAFARMDGTATDELLPQPAPNAPEIQRKSTKNNQSSSDLRSVPRPRRH
jgi:hypothetical protein